MASVRALSFPGRAIATAVTPCCLRVSSDNQPMPCKGTGALPSDCHSDRTTVLKAVR
jgi:hypothetical protein